MADIYRAANVVLAWLQSADESTDVASAFRFLPRIVAEKQYSDELSLLPTRFGVNVRLPKEYSFQLSQSDWRSVKALYSLRYWTRKWIVQELINARTVVLRVGNSDLSMTDFEQFCSELRKEKYRDETERHLSSASRDICDFALASPAALLALQRLEDSTTQRPRLLHELVKRYDNNECSLPCDHVYALYSLVGEHRKRLRIDYAARPMQRLVAIFQFVRTFEGLEPSRLVGFAGFLVSLLQIKQEDILQERRLSEESNIAVRAKDLGKVQLQPESDGSRALRRMVERLEAMPRILLSTSGKDWIRMPYKGSSGSQKPVARQDMTHFKLHDLFDGLATCRLRAGDTISHCPGTQLVFAVRRYRSHKALVLGRAYLFRDTGINPSNFKFWLGDNQQSRASTKLWQGEQQILVNLATLLEMGSLACLTKDVWAVSSNIRSGEFATSHGQSSRRSKGLRPGTRY